MPPSDAPRGIGPEEERSLTRRRFAAIGATVASIALAGCSAVINFLGSQLLNDVNVFNGTGRRITGSIEVTDPEGEVVLDEQFDLEPEQTEQEGEQSGESSAVYGDVLTVEGEYDVSVELTDGSEIDGETAAQGTVEVTDLENDHVAVLLGAGATDEPITFTVIQEFSDLGQFDTES